MPMTAKIACAVDPQGESVQALGFAAELAQALGSECHALHVVEQTLQPWPFIEPLSGEEVDRIARESIEGALRHHRATETTVQIHARQGHPAKEIIAFARELPADLLVLGRHHRGIRDAFVGSTAQKVIRGATCPTLIYKAHVVAMPERILAAVDLSEPSRHALDLAVQWAKVTGASVRLLAIFEPPEFYPGFTMNTVHVIDSARTWHNKAIDELLGQVDWQGVEHDVVRREGDPARCILEVAAEDQVDLVFLGTHGRTGLDRFLLGSVAEHVVNRLRCGVLVTGGKAPAELLEKAPKARAAPARSKRAR